MAGSADFITTQQHPSHVTVEDEEWVGAIEFLARHIGDDEIIERAGFSFVKGEPRPVTTEVSGMSDLELEDLFVPYAGARADPSQ